MPAGTYHFTLYCIIINPVTTTFSIALRRGGSDTTLASFTESYTPLGSGGYTPQPFEYDEPAPAIDFQPGDLFVYTYVAGSDSLPSSYEPNGDQVGGTPDPSITLPVGSDDDQPPST